MKSTQKEAVRKLLENCLNWNLLYINKQKAFLEASEALEKLFDENCTPLDNIYKNRMERKVIELQAAVVVAEKRVSSQVSEIAELVNKNEKLQAELEGCKEFLKEISELPESISKTLDLLFIKRKSAKLYKELMGES